MTATRTHPNLLSEARHLDDDSYPYGALILARSIGHELDAPCLLGCTRAQHMTITSILFGDIIREAFPGRALAARRMVVLQDASEVAYGA
jgi:hypothetical protein